MIKQSIGDFHCGEINIMTWYEKGDLMDKYFVIFLK